ncbi:MAG TPA: glycine betaine ABC transporter substrate-binding protein [Thermomicrobiales bacterium]|nr:glycine betaine ABC transporter substrate-binding protein [Thermomicrobiales bacterium]
MRFVQRVAIPIVVMLGLIFGSIGAVAAQDDDDKPTIVVGSKNFTEQILMSELVALTLEDAGYDVERQFGLGGTAVIHQAMWNDEIDIFVEYTGTALVAVLEMDVPTGDDGATPEGGDVATAVSSVADQTYQIVKDEYAGQWDIAWMDHFGFNNTYAMAVTQETAAELDLQTTSDLEEHAGDMTLGTDQEFPVREDGLPGFEETYGFGFGDVQAGDPGLMYAALDNGDVDVITAYSTDGRIPALDLVLLEDDKSFFPPYHPAPIVRQEVLDANPEIADVLNKLGGAITEDQMAEMNYQVDEEGRTTEDVAREFLEERGIIGG